MSHGPVFAERIDYEAAVAYLEAHLPEDVRPYADRMATETIDAALVGVRSGGGVSDYDTPETVAEGDLEMWFIPDIPGKEFRWKVDSGAEAEKLIEVLAAYNRYLHRRGLMDDYEADASGVEIFEDGEWTEFYGEGALADPGRTIAAAERERV